jgi:hypothetical protein
MCGLRRTKTVPGLAYLALAAILASGCSEDCPTDPCQGRVLWVSPEGQGSYPTIQHAVDAARDGDTIELADGRFEGTGNRDIDLLGKAITIRSMGITADACTIDCQGSEDDPHRAFHFHQGEDNATRVEGITIINGFSATHGGAILCDKESSPELAGLVITGCFANNQGGGLYATGASKPVVSSCHFVSNAARGGGAISTFGASPVIRQSRIERNRGLLGGGIELWVSAAGEPLVEGCTFVKNRGGSGGAMFIQQCQPVITDCYSSCNWGNFGGFIFCAEASPVVKRCTSFRDTTDHWGSALHCQGRCEPHFISCTLSHGYSGGETSGSAIHVHDNSDAFFTRSIVSFCTQGEAVHCSHSKATVTFSCSDVYGNELGDWTDCIEGQVGTQGNISSDPLFCDPGTGDLHLTAESPCGVDSSACGPIGAFSVRCD